MDRGFCSQLRGPLPPSTGYLGFGTPLLRYFHAISDSTADSNCFVSRFCIPVRWQPGLCDMQNAECCMTLDRSTTVSFRFQRVLLQMCSFGGACVMASTLYQCIGCVSSIMRSGQTQQCFSDEVHLHTTFIAARECRVKFMARFQMSQCIRGKFSRLFHCLSWQSSLRKQLANAHMLLAI